MAAYDIVLLPGDGTGPEVVRVARRALEAVADRRGLDLDFTEVPCGAQLYEKTGKEWAEGSFERCQEADAMLLGAVGWPGVSLPSGDIAGAGIVFGLRFGLDLYANLRPCKLYPGIRHKIHDAFASVWRPEKVDFVLVRENTEGLYTPIRGNLSRGGSTESAVDVNLITRKGAERACRFAFEEARRRRGAVGDGKKRVTCVDKSNVLAGSRLFREVFDDVGKAYPAIERDYAYIDAFMQWMVRSPEAYDVAVMTNMFGDIATDLAAVLQGGMGMAPAGNIGDRHAMFEPIHGSSPKHAGKDVVNPVACVLAAQMMLAWLGEKRHDAKMTGASQDLEAAVAAVVRDGVVTYDLGGRSSTTQVGDAIVARIVRGPDGP
ncbi:MAG: isocitrate/isopropylmalate dehydrogenase family protein [Methanobacteriota archaeon]